MGLIRLIKLIRSIGFITLHIKLTKPSDFPFII